jgi:hypothetical protein
MRTTSFNLRNVVIATCLALIMPFAACKDEADDALWEMEENGLTRGINSIISPEALKEFEDMGMPVHRGGNPPMNIMGSYVSSPDVCVATNINDNTRPGNVFNDFYLIFSEQNNAKMSIKVERVQIATGDGTGSYIVGDGNKFTVFSRMKKDNGKGHKYKTVDIFSGTITDEGIKDFYHSNLMIEGGGEGGLIKNGQGRVAYDSDGMAERIEN